MKIENITNIKLIINYEILNKMEKYIYFFTKIWLKFSFLSPKTMFYFIYKKTKNNE